MVSANFAIRGLRAGGTFLANALAAWIGTAILESLASSAIRPFTHSRSSTVIREWICSIVLAALIGVLVQQRWKTSTAKWVWVAGLLWFTFGLAGGLGFPIGSPWRTFSGMACVETQGIPCIQFWDFTVPLIRCASYSIAACLAIRARRHGLAGLSLDRLLAGLFLIGLPKPSHDQGPKGENSEQKNFT